MKINLTQSFTQNLAKNTSNVKSHDRQLDLPIQRHSDMFNLNVRQIVQTEVESEKNKIQASVTKINDFIEPVIADVKFVFHEDLHEYYVTVVNPLTDEVIREIPPKKMLDMYAAMTDFMGLLVDEKI